MGEKLTKEMSAEFLRYLADQEQTASFAERLRKIADMIESDNFDTI